MHYTKIECQLKIDKRQSLKVDMLKHYGYTYVATVSFSSCQRNLIKTFQIEAMIALITKMAMIFS